AMFKRVIIKTVGVSALCLMTLAGCSGDKPEVSEKGESDTAITISAINSKTLYTRQGSGSIAYRVIGSGHPLILCNRFRGTLDDWDPKFLDELAKSHTVVTFDYRGIGLSSLPDGTDTLMETQDVEDLTSMLGFNKFSLLGWSHGGKVAQIYAAKNASKVDHLVLLGTGPVGIAKFTPEKIFFDYALKPVNNFEDEIVLFFEPKYEESKIAARLSHGRMKERKSDTSKYVTPDKFPKYFQSVAKYNADKGAMDTLINGKMPILAVSGEHDIVFPVEDWYAQTKKNPNLQIIMLPKAGHGPQSQYPLQTARYINGFIAGE
ncbi:MAG: alpha/beta hydrolase, partial [Flavitalea sp.]